jgi:hypothetical protein
MSSRLLCVGYGITHLSCEKINSMNHHVRTQNICAIGCRPLCVILRGLLQTTPCVGCRQLVSSFANAPGVFVLYQAAKFLHVWSSGSIAQTSLPRGFSPVYITEHIPKYNSIEKIINYLSNGYSSILIGVYMRELWLFHFSFACCPEIFRTCNHW